MKEFELDDEDVMVRGIAVEAFIDAFGAYRSRGEMVLARFLGTEDDSIRSDGYYGATKLLAAFRELQDQFGVEFMYRAGHHLYERALFPPGIASFEDVLVALDEAYYLNHRNADGKIGHYKYTKTGPTSGLMVCDNPYPCALDMGLFAGSAERFDENASLTHEDEALCRHKGADQCIYRIEW